MKKIFRNLIVLVFVVFLIAVIMIMLNGSNNLNAPSFINKDKYYEVEKGSLNDIRLDRAYWFNEDVAVVLKDGRYGYIGTDGQIIGELKYDYASNFINGYGRVKLGDKYDLVDKEGNVLFGFIYDDTIPISENVFMVNVNKKDVLIIDRQGNTIDRINDAEPVDIDTESFAVILKDKAGTYYVYDSKGERKAEIKDYTCLSINENYIIAKNSEDRYGYLDITGNPVIDFKYLECEDFENGKAIAIDSEGTHIIDDKGNIVLTTTEDYLEIETPDENGLCLIRTNDGYGLIDLNGNVVVEPIYDEINNFYDGLAKVELDELYGYINTKGEIIIPIEYEEAVAFTDGIAPVKKDEYWQLIDTTGKSINGYLYDYYFINTLTCDRFLVFDENNNYGFLDKEGNLVIGSLDDLEDSYESITSSVGQPVFNVEKDGYVYLIDKDGNKINDELYDDEVYFISSDYASASKDLKYGIIDKEGNTVIPFEYGKTSINNTNEYVIFADEGDNYGLMDIKGNVLIEPEYESIRGPFINNYFILLLDEKYGIQDSEGNVIIDFEYDYIADFTSLDAIPVQNGGNSALINSENQIIVNYGKYEDIEEISIPGRFVVELNDREGLIDGKGNMIIPINYYDIICSDLDYQSDKLILVSDQNKYAYFNKDGKNVTGFIYDDGKEFKNGYAPVEKDGKWGYIDVSGKEIIPCQYNLTFDFSKDNHAIVANVGNGYVDYKIVDNTGAVVFESSKSNILCFFWSRLTVIHANLY